ncbi:protein-disulfide reductase DsbD domain-containing protein [Candidatus Latescibacterota bacterium]
MLSKKLFYSLIVLLLIPHITYGQNEKVIRPVRVEGVISTDKVRPGSRFHVAIIVDISEGWYINAHSPLEDYLIPTVLRFKDASGLKFSEIIYPDPVLKTFRFSGQKLAVYESKAIIGSRVSASEVLSKGELIIPGTLTYQACNNDMCLIPIEVEINIPVEIAGLEEPVHRINDELFSPLETIWAHAEKNGDKGLKDEAFTEFEEMKK